MEKSFKTMIEVCASANKKEDIIIVADYNKLNLAKQFFKYLLKNKYNVNLTLISDMEIDGEEPNKNIEILIANSNIVFYMTTYSLTHTQATKNALKNNAKVISMPNITTKLIKNHIDLDYLEMKKITNELTDILTNGKKATITTKKGTNLKLDISKNKGNGLFGICGKSKLINLPDGEACIFPYSANGTLVIDGSMPPDTQSKWGKIGKIKTPIKLKIKNGKIIDFIGKKESGILKNVLNFYGEKAKIIAELGIGTNKTAKKITGNVTIDEKIYGTIHIAFGNSINLGGNNDIPIHLDAVITKPTLIIDNKLIIQKGQFKI